MPHHSLMRLSDIGPNRTAAETTRGLNDSSLRLNRPKPNIIYLSIFLYVLTHEGDIRRVPKRPSLTKLNQHRAQTTHILESSRLFLQSEAFREESFITRWWRGAVTFSCGRQTFWRPPPPNPVRKNILDPPPTPDIWQKYLWPPPSPAPKTPFFFLAALNHNEGS